MKYLLGILFICNIALGQYNDGYHVEPVNTCTTGECLIVGDSIFEMITKVDMHGNEYTELNSEASLLDVFYRGMKVEACFNGTDLDVLKDIIYALEGNSNYHWARGGHERVKYAYFIKRELDLSKIRLVWESDYLIMEIEDHYSITSCK
jgi:hypothetical protein